MGYGHVNVLDQVRAGFLVLEGTLFEDQTAGLLVFEFYCGFGRVGFDVLGGLEFGAIAGVLVLLLAKEGSAGVFHWGCAVGFEVEDTAGRRGNSATAAEKAAGFWLVRVVSLRKQAS